MNEQLQSKLVEILAGIQSATKAAGDFALEQLPDIAQQYVVYGRVSLTVYLLLGVSMLTAAVLFMRAGARMAKARNDAGLRYASESRAGVPSEAEIVFSFVGFGISGLFGLAFFFANFGACVLVWFAPKVWLLKEIASLIK